MQIQSYPLSSVITLRGRYFECSQPRHNPVLCLAGYSRNSVDFLKLAEALSDSRIVVALDTRGRGLSDWGAPETYTADQEARDVIEVIAQLGWQTFDIIGTSRGGVLAQILTAALPEQVDRIILNDMGPALEVAGLRAIQNSLQARLSTPIASWAAAEAFLRPYTERYFPAWDAEDFQNFVQGSYQAHGGGIRLAFDPELAGVFTNSFDPDNTPDLWPIFEFVKNKPVMLVWGELSTLLSAATVAQMKAAKTDLLVLPVAGQAHPPALRSAAEINAVKHFLGV